MQDACFPHTTENKYCTRHKENTYASIFNVLFEKSSLKTLEVVPPTVVLAPPKNLPPPSSPYNPMLNCILV
jgi:hypothetical protein